ncbi:MAG: TRAP transporter substrate-binding protein DctP [Pseudomonadota bacterium]|nr:TRAP transporter substrate-binding protein DctP [Pseudomonadota bacterium]
MMRLRITCLVAALAWLAGCAPGTSGDVVELVYATPYSPAHPFSRADRTWMDFVEQRSGGTLRIRPSWSGAMLSSEHSMVELRHGVVDIGLVTPIYVKGGAHLIRIQSGFYSGVTSIENQVALYRCLASVHPGFARELEGLQVLAVQGGSLPGIITRERPVRSLDDLRGLRLRVPTELLQLMQDLGADPVNMPMGDVYSALAKGVIDGLVAPTDTFKSLHLAEVAHYYASLEVPRGAYPARAMGARRWKSLSPEHRAVLEEGVAVWEHALAEENRRALDEGWSLAEQRGVQLARISAADQTRFEDLYLQHAERNAAGLARYGIDGMAVFRTARASIAPDGSIDCAEHRE